MTTRGKYIVVEGADGSGKTTAAKLLQEKLTAKGRTVQKVNILKDESVAAKIRAILTDPENTIHPDAEAALYAAAVTNTYRLMVMPLLEQGIDVICDRNQISTWAYQVAPQDALGNHRPGAIYNAAYNDIQPDLLFVLTVDPEVGLARCSVRDGKLDRLELRGPEYQRQVQQAYRDYCDTLTNRGYVHFYENDTTLEELESFVSYVAEQV